MQTRPRRRVYQCCSPCTQNSTLRNLIIDLAIAVFNDRLEIEICDWGQPFDLKAKLKEELPEKNLFSWNELGFTFY